MKIELDKVTVICIDTLNIGAASIALKKTLSEIKPAYCKFLTNVDVQIDGVETIIIPTINSQKEYSKFCIKYLNDYFDTEFLLIIQHDGFVIDGKQWSDKFYNYDYIGASWLYQDGRNVGNGGFSFRSKKLQKILAEDETIELYHPEDEVIGRLYRSYLESKGIVFATEDVADKFSYELREPNQKTFGFHGNFHLPYKETVVIQRRASLGDVVQIEPVLEWYYNKGYRVVVDTLPQFKDLFRQHYFRVEFFDEFDHYRIPYKIINLDMSYESKPDQLHLKTYYEFAGITDGEIKDPTLNLFQDYKKDIKLFKKYVVLHIDNREQPYRNIYGIEWVKVVEYLKHLGYTVIQLGNDLTCHIPNAIQMKTPSTQFLMWVCSGADLMIGIDSGISHICSGFKVPSILFFGSVDPNVIHPTSENKIYIYNKNVCDTPFCWSNVVGGTSGKPCVVNEQKPPCTQYQTIQLLNAIKQITNDKN
jgi:hypothetical protein